MRIRFAKAPGSLARPYRSEERASTPSGQRSPPLHAEAVCPDETDWRQISELYALLLGLAPSPVVELNRAVAVAKAYGPKEGLRLLDALQNRGDLPGYHLLPAARAQLLERLSRLSKPPKPTAELSPSSPTRPNAASSNAAWHEWRSRVRRAPRGCHAEEASVSPHAAARVRRRDGGVGPGSDVFLSRRRLPGDRPRRRPRDEGTALQGMPRRGPASWRSPPESRACRRIPALDRSSSPATG